MNAAERERLEAASGKKARAQRKAETAVSPARVSLARPRAAHSAVGAAPLPGAAEHALPPPNALSVTRRPLLPSRQELRKRAASTKLHVLVNCAYDCNSARERQSLAHQLMRVYAANKRHAAAAAGHVLVWRPPADVHARLLKIDVDNWVAFGVVPRPDRGGTAGSAGELSASADEDALAGAASLAACPLVSEHRDRVVVLTPDSGNVLEDVAEDAIVVIGGIVDRTIRKNQTMRTAEALGLAHARLPVQRSLEEAGAASLTRTVVLNVDTVAEAVFRRRVSGVPTGGSGERTGPGSSVACSSRVPGAL